MKYRSETRFQLFEPVQVNPGVETVPYKVPAGGCNSICFLALPMTAQSDDPWLLSENFGVQDLLKYVPRINGIPLLPTILGNVYEGAASVNGAVDGLTGHLLRLQAGDRLEFNNSPGVQDETIYEVHHRSGVFLGFRVQLMVIRRFLFLI